MTPDQVARQVADIYGVGDTPVVYPAQFQKAVNVVAAALADRVKELESSLSKAIAKKEEAEAKAQWLDGKLKKLGVLMAQIKANLLYLDAIDPDPAKFFPEEFRLLTVTDPAEGKEASLALHDLIDKGMPPNG